MKKLLIGLLILGSFSAFASILEVDATKDEIRDAIIASFDQHDLNCVNLVNNKQYKASELNISNLFKNDYKQIVSSDLSQPLITMIKNGIEGFPKARYELIVTTDRTLKIVTKLTLKSYSDSTIVLVNEGTILKPVFTEELIAGTIFEDLICQ